MPKRKAAEVSPSAAVSSSSSLPAHQHQHVYLVIQTTDTQSAYSYHSGDSADVVAVYSTPQAANAAAINHFLSLHTDHTSVHCNDTQALVQIVAEGSRGGDMMVYVEEHGVVEEESQVSVQELVVKLKQTTTAARRRAREERRRQEEEDGGYDSYGEPINDSKVHKAPRAATRAKKQTSVERRKSKR